MDETFEFDLDPVTFITIGTEGPPGHRTFYLQAARSREVVSLVIEKEQAVALAASIDRLLASVDEEGIVPLMKEPDPGQNLLVPLEAAFRVAEMGIGIDESREVFVLVSREVPEDEGEGRSARFVATFEQMLALARTALFVAGQGRPVCKLCGEPVDPEGHACPRKNGHATQRS